MQVSCWSLLCLLWCYIQVVRPQGLTSQLKQGSRGLVLLKLYNNYGVVCRNNFTYQDAAVVCKPFPGSQAPRIYALPVNGSKIWLKSLGCVGNEIDVDHCNKDGWEPPSCPGRNAAAVDCSGSGPSPTPAPVTPAPAAAPALNDLLRIQLSGGTRGRVLASVYGESGTICGRNFGTAEAKVVCRMAGYSADRARRIYTYGPGTGTVWLSDVSCTGRELSLDKCNIGSWKAVNCDHSQDAWVDCGSLQPTRPVPTIAPTRPPRPTSIRIELEGGPANSRSGRVVAIANNIRGTICNVNFGDEDAKVICNMAGYSADGARAANYFGAGRGTILFSNLGCGGYESSILYCTYIWRPQNCQHGQDAGVICAYTVPPTRPVPTIAPRPTSVRIQLEGGAPNSRSGRVVAIVNNIRGTICNVNFGNEDAKVICRMAGYSTDGARVANNFGAGRGTILFSNLGCRGYESSILYCTYIWRPQNCQHGQDAGVICGYTVPPTQPTIPYNHLRIELEAGVPNSGSGRLVAIADGVRGTICGANFGINEAKVMCRMAGYSDVRSAHPVYNFGPGTGPIWMSKLSCNGNENTVRYCYKEWRPQDCQHYQDVGVDCGNTVRPTQPVTSITTTSPQSSRLRIELEGSPYSHSGRVVAIYDGNRGTICNSNFGVEDAKVACRMAGYSYAAARTRYFGPGRGRIWLTNLGCRGYERTLLDCSKDWNTQYCQHSQDVGVICGDTPPPTLPPTLHPPNPSLRIVLEGGSSNSQSGRIVAFINNVRGTICYMNFGIGDAKVACRMAGYSDVGAAPVYFGAGTGRIWLTNLGCQGYERTLLECSKDWNTGNCQHSQDIGVRCGNPTRLTTIRPTTQITVQPPYRQISVQLTGGQRGIVMVIVDGRRGTICNLDFGREDAKVICRMAGYSDIGAYPEYSGQGTGKIWLSRIGCQGNELSLDYCQKQWNPQDCQHFQDVGVVCGNTVRPTQVPPQPPVRVVLVDGVDSHHGRVVVHYNNQDGTICDDRFDDEDAKVICRMIGYTGTGVRAAKTYYGPGLKGGRIWLDNMQCVGTEASVLQCRHSPWGDTDCRHHEDVSVFCGPRRNPSPHVRVFLVDGPDSRHGRLIVEYNNENGTVCNDLFSLRNTKIVCRMLGYGGDQLSYNTVYGAGYGKILLDDVFCVGEENSISECIHRGWGRHDCTHEHDVSVGCGPITGGPRTTIGPRRP